jgi:hypothetical protein
MTEHVNAHTDGASPLETLALSLQEETVGTQKKAADFEEAYPTLEQHLKRKVPLKVVLAKFNVAYGHGLHPPAFRKLLESERKRRMESGHAVTCSACGQALASPSDVAPQHDANHPGDQT